MTTVVKLFLVCVISVGFLMACSFNARDCTYCVFKKNSNEKVWTMLLVDDRGVNDDNRELIRKYK